MSRDYGSADRYPSVGWLDRAGSVRSYPGGQPMPSGPRRTRKVHHPGEGYVVGSAEHPKLLKEQKFAYRLLIILVMTIVALVGAKLAGYGFVAIYHDTIGGLFPAVKDAWDSFFSIDWLRHLVRDIEFEKMPAFTALQLVGYNFANHWPRKPASRLDRIEDRLGVPNAHIENQGVLKVIVGGIFWLLIYSGVGFAIFCTVLWLTGTTAVEPTSWQLLVGGLFASWVFGRRVAKGIAYHMQRITIRERLEDGKTKPAWWMLWPLRWRFEWNATHPETRVKPSRRWEHYRLQRALHKAVMCVIILGALFLIGQGFVILYEFAHGPIMWSQIIPAVKYAVTAWL